MTTADIKTSVKKIIKRGLGQPGLSKKSLQDTLTILVYHEVTDNPSQFCEMYDLNVPPGLYREQMRFINDNFNIIDPDQLLEGGFATPAAMITFDDGYPGYFREAVPIMTEMGIPSINFLNMAPISGELFWSGLITYLTTFDDGFQKVISNLYPNRGSQVPDFLLCNTKMVDDYLASVDAKALEEKVRAFYGPFASLEDLESTKNNPLVFLANHLYKHYNAAMLDDEALKEQYQLNHDKLHMYPNYRKMFAYPFGQPGSCFKEHQTEFLKSCGADVVFFSGGGINKNVRNRFYNRIGISANTQTLEDLLGRIQWIRLRGLIKGR